MPSDGIPETLESGGINKQTVLSRAGGLRSWMRNAPKQHGVYLGRRIPILEKSSAGL